MALEDCELVDGADQWALDKRATCRIGALSQNGRGTVVLLGWRRVAVVSVRFRGTSP